MLLKYLKKNALTNPNKSIFISGNDCLTNKELYLKVRSCMEFFIEKECLKKKLIIEFKKEITIIPILFAAIILGMNSCLIDLKRMPKLKKYIKSVFDTDLFVSEKRIVIDNQEVSLNEIYLKKQGSFESISHKKERKNQEVLTIFTSGTTGKPKGIVIQKCNLYFCIRSILSKINIDSNDRIALCLPITFDYGLYHLFFAVVRMASLEFFKEEFSDFKLIRFIEKKKITFLPSLPQITLNLLWIAKKSKNFNISSLKTITNTGEALNPKSQVIAWELNPNLNIYFMYGVSECKRVSILSPTEYRIKPYSVGKPIPGTEAFIIDKQTQKMKKKGFGELVVKGPNVTAGYYGIDDNQTENSFFIFNGEKYFRTGDLFSIDNDGYLYFKERKSQIVKHNGFRIDPVEIESCAVNISNVLFAKVICIDDNLTLIYQGNCSVNYVNLILKKNLDMYKVPKILKLENIPLTQNGKVDIKQIKKKYSN